MTMARAVLAYLFLVFSFAATLVCAALGRMVPRQRRNKTGRLLITGRFDSRNWFISNAVRLVRSGVNKVIVVPEVQQEQLAGLRFVRPPRWGAEGFQGAISKIAWMIDVGLRFKPDAYKGYHLFPGTMSVLIVASWFGRPACYQMTGGPIEIAGG